MALRILIIGPPRSGTSMVARVMYHSGFTLGGEFDGPNNCSDISTFEDVALRNIAWRMRDALLGQMHQKEHRNTAERINTLHQAVQDYPYEAFKLPNILHAWDTWKAAISPETIIILVHRDAELIAKSMEKLKRGENHQERIKLVAWCEQRMDKIRAEMKYVIDVNFQDYLTSEGQAIIKKKFLDYFPDRPLDFSSIKPAKGTKNAVKASDDKIKYTISIIYHKLFDRLKRLIESIHRFPPAGKYEILLTGDNLTVDEQRALADLQGDEPWTLTHLEGQVPASIAINLNMCRAKGDYILLCDDDIEFIHPGWAERLAATLKEPVVAASAVTPAVAGGKQKVRADHNPDDYTAAIWDVEGTWWGGWCFMTKREVFDFKHPNFIGYYDTFAMSQGNDKDWLRRLFLYGHKAVICPSAMVIHHGCMKEASHGHVPAATQFKFSQPNYEKKWKILSNV